MSELIFVRSIRGDGPTPYLVVEKDRYMVTLRDMLTGQLVLRSHIRFDDYETLSRVLFF